MEDARPLRQSFICAVLALLAIAISNTSQAQNFERYRPLDPSRLPNTTAPETVPAPDLPAANQDDRLLIDCLQAVVVVDRADKVSLDPRIDDLHGLQYNVAAEDSLVFSDSIRNILHAHIGRPLSLRSLNQLARQISKVYRDGGQPIVDVQIPEQRISGGTLHLVIVESIIGRVLIEPGCVFSCDELDRWIDCTCPGDRVYEDKLQSDLFWVNQNPFRRVKVDFRPGETAGTTDVIYKSHDVMPLRGYIGGDDTGVKSLNYGRLFAGVMYGNLFNRGGQLSYQYTTDQSFQHLHAHSVSYNHAVNRRYSVGAYGSHATVSPMLSGGLSQDGESWQVGVNATRHLIREAQHSRNLTAGIDFKSTNNNLEFAGSTVSASNADLVQLRFGIDDFVRSSVDEYMLLKGEIFAGPGGGLTGAHSTAAFQTLRPGTSTDYVYARFTGEDTSLVGRSWMLLSRLTGQVSSERLLFSETLGLGGYDTIRGFDQRAFNADSGWIANFEFGPRTERWGAEDDIHSRRFFVFTDLGNGYLSNARPGEDAYTFAASAGVGLRFNVSDRLSCRLDYGYGWQDISNSERSNRLHMGFTWIPGERP